MRLSVVIPALNEEASIATAISAAWAAGATEVIVVDGGSRDGTCAECVGVPCRLLHGETGRGQQQRLGTEQASGEVVLFQHADCRLAADCGRQIRSAVQDGGAVAGAFRQRIEASGILFRLLERGNAARARWLGMPYGDQGIFVRRDVLRRMGGFPAVPLMEDVILMRRVRRVARPVLLPGPIHVQARRWRRHGVVRQTLRNWTLLAAYFWGIPPETLIRFYRRHDAPEAAYGPASAEARADRDSV
jgi:rSAM/selenodomain-associated transferase 2